MGLVGVQHHDISMLQSELFTREVSDGSENALRWRAGRHREHELVNELRHRPTSHGRELGLPAVGLQIEIPAIEDFLACAPLLYVPPVVGFELQFPSAADVVDDT